MADEKVLIEIEVDNQQALRDLDRQNLEIKELEESQKKLAASSGKNTAQYQKQATQLKKLRSERNQNLKAISAEKGSLNELRANLANLTRQRNALTDVNGKNRDSFKRLTKEIDKQNTSIKRAEQAGGDFRRNVGNYRGAFDSATSSVTGFNTALLANPLLAIGAAIAFVGREVFNFSRTFDTSMSKVQAVTGSTSKEMEVLRDNAIKLGESSKFTATQVAELQVELGKLGFSSEEIQESTSSIIDLATAADTDLAEAARVTASTLNQFNLTTEETGRVVDVMASSFSSSALDLEKFSTGLGIVGPAGNAVGASLETVTAILAKTADNGIDASTSASALRNIFIDLSDKGLSFEDALSRITNSQDKLTTANDLFGKRGAVVSTVIAENIDSIKELDVQFQNAAGSAKEMADIVSNNLQGDLDRLSSSWEGLIARFSGGLGKAFRVVVVTIQFAIDLIKQFGTDLLFLASPSGAIFFFAKVFKKDISTAIDKVSLQFLNFTIGFKEGIKSALEFLGVSTKGIQDSISNDMMKAAKIQEGIANDRIKFEGEKQEETLTAWEIYQENLARISREYKDKEIADKLKKDEEALAKYLETKEKEDKAATKAFNKKLSLENELIILKKQFDIIGAKTDEEKYQRELELLQIRKQQELNQENITNEQKLVIKQNFENSKLALDIRYANDTDKIRQEQAKKDEKDQRERRSRRSKTIDFGNGLLQNAFSIAQSLAGEDEKRQKTISRIQAITNTAVGVTKAFATLGPIAGIPAAAAVAASGAAQLVAINNSSSGGSVSAPSGGASNNPTINTSPQDQAFQQQQALEAALDNLGLTVSVTEINDAQNAVQVADSTATI